MSIYIFTITYNFDGSYVAIKCGTFDEAKEMLDHYLQEEIKCVEKEQNYSPSVLTWSDDDITLVYAEGYTKNICMEEMRKSHQRSYANEDCAYYRIFEVQE